jgi:hypothetical protein
MGTIETHFPFARMFMFLITLILLIFLSSPTAMLSRLQKIDPTSFLNLTWTKEYGRIGVYMHKLIPPSIILIINVTIISALDFASVIEGYNSHSRY